MAKCEQQQFTGITVAQFAQMQSHGQTAGLPIQGDRGQLTRDGITLAWVYDAGTSTLTIECTDAPFFVPCTMINAKIKSAVSEILTSLA